MYASPDYLWGLIDRITVGGITIGKITIGKITMGSPA
jgi:hypothetical protein